MLFKSCEKVQMHGVVCDVNLANLNGYDQLLNDFELLFDLKGLDLQNRNKYIMLVGDIPWL